MTRRAIHDFAFLIVLLFSSCANISNENSKSRSLEGVKLFVLGTAQDAGAPQLACQKKCCEALKASEEKRKVVSLALVDYRNQKKYLFEATPDITEQLDDLNHLAPFSSPFPDGVFLSHGHIGHYTGLMYFGRESASSRNLPVYTMPLMKSFLENNGPWSQLVELQNIDLVSVNSNEKVLLENNLTVEPFKVPHRDEFSETAGFRIDGPSHSALFIPDIDKWAKWEVPIDSLIGTVDFAFIDATFYNGNELPNRNMDEIPHPFVVESMKLFDQLEEGMKSKIYFIHFNHTNPLLDYESKESHEVYRLGYNIARSGQSFDL